MGVQEKKVLAEGPYGEEFMSGYATERKEREELVRDCGKVQNHDRVLILQNDVEPVAQNVKSYACNEVPRL